MRVSTGSSIEGTAIFIQRFVPDVLHCEAIEGCVWSTPGARQNVMKLDVCISELQTASRSRLLHFLNKISYGDQASLISWLSFTAHHGSEQQHCCWRCECERREEAWRPPSPQIVLRAAKEDRQGDPQAAEDQANAWAPRGHRDFHPKIRPPGARRSLSRLRSRLPTRVG